MAQMKMLRQVMSPADIYTHADTICEMLRDHYGSYDADSLDEVSVDETFVQRLSARGYDILPEGAVIEDRPAPPPSPSRREFPRAEINSAPPRRIAPSNGSGVPMRRPSEGDGALPRRREPGSDGESQSLPRRRPMQGEQESPPIRRRPVAGESSLPMRRPAPAPGSDGVPFRQRVGPSQPPTPMRPNMGPPAGPPPTPMIESAGPNSDQASDLPSRPPLAESGPVMDAIAAQPDAVVSSLEQIVAPTETPQEEPATIPAEGPAAAAPVQPSTTVEPPVAAAADVVPATDADGTPPAAAKPAPRKRASRAKVAKPAEPEQPES